MAKLKLTVNHNLSKQEALNRIKNLLGETKKEFADQINNLKEEWVGNAGTFSFETRGASISGTLFVNLFQVDLSGEIPFRLKILQNDIKSIITKKANELLTEK